MYTATHPALTRAAADRCGFQMTWLLEKKMRPQSTSMHNNFEEALRAVGRKGVRAPASMRLTQPVEPSYQARLELGLLGLPAWLAEVRSEGPKGL